jgi:hypothetical protein
VSALTRSTIQLAKERDCQELARHYCLRKAGGTRGGKELYYDPRGEQHPSLQVTPDGFYRYGTGEHGDAIAFEQFLTGCLFREAVERLVGTLTTPAILPFARPVPKHVRRVSEAWQQAALAVVEQAEQYLWSDRPDAVNARAYLHKRGLSDETIRRWRLGFNPRWIETTYTKEDGTRANVAPGIVIPSFFEGEIQAVKVRRFTGDVKYIQMAGGNPAPLFGADLIRPDLPVAIVEGEFDAMIGNQEAGDLVVFVTIGSSSNKLTEATRARLELAAWLMVAPDNDDAGEHFREYITNTLPLTAVATIPAGKDVTEFVTMHAGNVRQWIATIPTPSPALIFAGLPDSVRSTALNAKLETALIVYELAIAAKLKEFTGGELLEFVARLEAGIAKHAIYRGLKQGLGVFFTSVAKSDSSNTPSSIDQNLVSDFATEQTTDQRYTIMPPDQIVAGLQARLPNRLIERLFPLRRDELPPIEAELLDAVGCDNAAEAATQVQAVVDALTSDAERTKVERKVKAQRWMLDRLLRQLTQRKTTPIRWIAGVDFKAQFYRAIVEADPKPRSQNEIALLVGLGRQNLDRLLARAGVKSEQRPSERITLTDPEQLDTTVATLYQRAKGNGQIVAMRSVDERGAGEPIPFASDKVKSWAATELAQGHKVEFTIKLCNEQKIAGEVQPRQKPTRVRTAPVERDNSTSDNLTLLDISPPRTRKPTYEPYTGPGYAPDYARATLIKIHARAWAMSPNDPSYDDITNRDLIGMIIDEPFRDVSASGELLINALIAQHGGTVITEAKPATAQTLLDCLLFDHGGKVIETPHTIVDTPCNETINTASMVDEHPGKALLEAYNALPEGLPRYEYHDNLTIAQRRDLIDYKHSIRKVA